MNEHDSAGTSDAATISPFGRYAIAIVAFLGWFFAGVQLAITTIVMRVAAADLLPADASEGEIGKWVGWLVCAFLFGAAAGGYLFGLIGDRIGRARAMAASIFCYSIFSGLTILVTDPWGLLVLRFLTCMGIGGMWPSGISLLSEAWSGVARPILAGIMGTAANVGILCFALLTMVVHVEQDDWRWTMLVGAAPIILGLLSLAIVPESPRWLALRQREVDGQHDESPVGLGEIFRPPLLKTTLLGILLGTIPLFGGWGVSNWATAWASEAGDKSSTAANEDDDDGDRLEEMPNEDDNGGDELEATPNEGDDAQPDPTLKSRVAFARALPGSISSLLGGALAFYFGRKRTYFTLCLCALICAQMLFRCESPQDEQFLFWTAALGLFSGFFFGWLPLCLPELFPTRVRSTGAGVSFNWGRILTGIGVLASAFALKSAFEGRYADVGQVTGLIYGVGIVAILLTPKMTDSALED